ncbi:MAG: metallophosphoesterase [Victivallaceae bacterium]|nr:metallophosphoesterase [Victivallaceae bacterium]
MRRALVLVVAIVALIVLVAAVYGFFVEPRRLVVERVRYDMPMWRSPENLRIVVLSDLHLFPMNGDARWGDRIVQTTNSLEPDIILLAGDYVRVGIDSFSSPQAAGEFGTFVSKLKSRCGVFIVSGNHDLTYGWRYLADAAESAGAVSLDNTSRLIRIHDQDVQIVGVPECELGEIDVARAFSNVDRTLPIIFLTHRGEAVYKCLCTGNIGLTVCGHTHGGQVRIPWSRRIMAPGIASWGYGGFASIGKHDIYVTRGIGGHRLDLRMFCPPEITLLEVTGGKYDEAG